MKKIYALPLILLMISAAFAGCIGADETIETVENTATEILGCTDEAAQNYDEDATADDGSCTYSGDDMEALESDIDCDVFSAPTVNHDAVFGELNADGEVELIVDSGLVTVIIDCIDINGNSDVGIATSVGASDAAGEPAMRGVVLVSDDDADSEGRDVTWGTPVGCWVNQNQMTNWITSGNNDVEPPIGVPDVVYTYGPYVGGNQWIEPCPPFMSAGGSSSGSDSHVSTGLTINAEPGHATHVPIVVVTTTGTTATTGSGEAGGAGTFVVTVVPSNTTVPDCYNRCISGWPGKVNQHIFNGTWDTDPDGVSGWHLSTEYSTGYADRKLEYCQKWWPDTTSVSLRTFRETISYYNAGNPEPPIPSTRDVYDCLVEEAQDSDGDGLSDWDEINVYGTNASNPDTDGDGISDGDEVNNGTNPLDPNCRSSSGWSDEQNRVAEDESCWRNTEERQNFVVTVDRERNGQRIVRTFTQHNGLLLSHSMIMATHFAPMPLTVHWCPAHAPDFVGNYQNSHHPNHHQGWAPGHPSMAGQYPGPPNHDSITIMATTSTAPGTTPENNHLWMWDWDDWDWDCIGPAGGHEKTAQGNPSTWYYLCPAHSGNMDDSVYWAGEYGHFSIPPFNYTPDPPQPLIVDSHTTDYYGENEHSWSYEYFDGVSPPGPSGWRWVCVGSSVGEV